MTPILTKDFKDFIELLLKHKVDFLICGGHAVAFHGYPRLTMDFDILIKPSDENAGKLMIVLHEFGFGEADIEKKLFTREGTAVTLGAQPNQIDLLTSCSTQTTDKVFRNAVYGRLGEFNVLFISKEDLLRGKKEAGRQKDLADIEELGKI